VKREDGEKMIIEIKPLDTVFFRDAKPFSMVEETWADSMPLPYPSVVYGALRSVYFAGDMDMFQKLHRGRKLDSREDPTTTLGIRRILLKDKNNNYYPLPLDCLKKKDDRGKDAFLSKCVENKATSSLITERRLEAFDKNEMHERVNDGILNSWEFIDYLNGEKAKFNYLKLSDFIESEPKIGIGRSKNTHTTEEGKLYRVGMQRLKDIKIVIEFAGLDIPEKGLLRLGGEGKAAEYDQVEEIESIEMPAIDDNLFKIYLATPAIFDNGWLPSWINEETLEGEIPETGNRVKLITAAIGKPLYVGGFNMKARRPKPMHRAVPQGSVYYFKIPRNGDRSNLESIHGQSISDKRKEEGFGICYIGNVKGVQE
jgi:CRISPR-associated protein Cmr3